VKSNLALALLSVVGTFALMATSRRRGKGDGPPLSEGPPPLPTGEDTSPCTWVPPGPNIPPSVVKRANELQALANKNNVSLGTEWVEKVGEDIWKFRREMHGPNAEHPTDHPGVGVRRCVRHEEPKQEGSTATGAEPDTAECTWIAPTEAPGPAVLRRALELERSPTPIGTEWVEQIDGEIWKFRKEIQGPNARTPRYHVGLGVRRCSQPAEGGKNPKQGITEAPAELLEKSGEADAIFQAALAELRGLGGQMANGWPNGAEVAGGSMAAPAPCKC
jgi:hypothetical protein